MIHNVLIVNKERRIKGFNDSAVRVCEENTTHVVRDNQKRLVTEVWKLHLRDNIN